MVEAGDDALLTAPRLYLSSADAGWEGLIAEAFHEPPALDGWWTRASADLTLILFAGGPLHLEQRTRAAAWAGWEIGPGDLILRPGGGLPAEVRWQSRTRTPTRTLHLHLNGHLLARTAAELTGQERALRGLRAQVGLHDPLLAQIGRAVWRELAAATPGGKLYAETAAHLLAVHLLRHYTPAGPALAESAGGLTAGQVRRVQDYIQAHLDSDLTLAALAAQTGLSPYHFARRFRTTTGTSPHQFVLRQRLAHAATLLRGGDHALAEIALASGFADQSHFTQAFKRWCGQTPSTYRREHRSAHFQ